MGLFDNLFELVADTVEMPIKTAEDLLDGDITLSGTRDKAKDAVEDVSNAIKSTLDMDM
jgi:hypothetical protein